MLTFLVGGARSGKSTLAVQMGEHHGGAVHFLATAEPFDDDLRDRIARHRAERPDGWTTEEVPVELAQAVLAAPRESFLIVDCLTVWMANLMMHSPAPSEAGGFVEHHVAQLAEALRHRAGVSHAPIVVVSNEVGMGIHPESPMGRDYRDHLGRTNQLVAAVADRSLLMVAGRALRLDNPWELLR